MNFEYTFQITNSYMTVTRSLTNNTVPLNGAKLPPNFLERKRNCLLIFKKQSRCCTGKTYYRYIDIYSLRSCYFFHRMDEK